MSDKIKVFLCYAKEDLEKVEELYNKLEKEGFEPWLDGEDILPGEQWDPTIRQAIRNSDFFIACLSYHSVTKDGYLNREINEALKIWEEKSEDKIFLIPARLEECNVPKRLKDFQWANVYTPRGFKKLLAALRTQQNKEKTKPTKKKSKPTAETSYDDRFTTQKNGAVFETFPKLKNQEDSFEHVINHDLGDWHFAIDFGTSVTTISYGIYNEGHPKVWLAKLEKNEIILPSYFYLNNEDEKLVYSNKRRFNKEEFSDEDLFNLLLKGKIIFEAKNDDGSIFFSKNIRSADQLKDQLIQMEFKPRSVDLVMDTWLAHSIPVVDLGEDAEFNMAMNHKYGFVSIKSLIGAKNYLKVADNTIELEKVLGGILQSFYNRLVKYNHNIEEKNIKRLTLSAPNTFSPGKIEVLKQACTLILNGQGEQVFEKEHIDILREAEASAFSYVHSTNIEEDCNILVYDMGAGTLDIALVQLKVEAKDGNDAKTLDILHRLGYPVGGNRLDVIVAEELWDIQIESQKEDKNLTKDKMFNFQQNEEQLNDKKLKGLRRTLKRASESVKKGGNSVFAGICLRYERFMNNYNKDRIEQYLSLAIDGPLDNLIDYAKNSFDIQHVDKVFVSGRATFYPGIKVRLAAKLHERNFILLNENSELYEFNKIVESDIFAFNEVKFKNLDIPESLKTPVSLSKYCLSYGALLHSVEKEHKSLFLSNDRIYGTYCTFFSYTKFEGNQETYLDDNGKEQPFRTVMKIIIERGQIMKPFHGQIKSVKGRANGVKMRRGKLNIFYAQGNYPHLDYEIDRMLELDCIFSERVYLNSKDGYFDVEMEIFNDDTWTITVWDQDRSQILVDRESMRNMVFDIDFGCTDEELKYKYWPYSMADFARGI